jgi:hypothetical protein
MPRGRRELAYRTGTVVVVVGDEEGSAAIEGQGMGGIQPGERGFGCGGARRELAHRACIAIGDEEVAATVEGEDVGFVQPGERLVADGADRGRAVDALGGAAEGDVGPIDRGAGVDRQCPDSIVARSGGGHVRGQGQGAGAAVDRLIRGAGHIAHGLQRDIAALAIDVSVNAQRRVGAGGHQADTGVVCRDRSTAGGRDALGRRRGQAPGLEA